MNWLPSFSITMTIQHVSTEALRILIGDPYWLPKQPAMKKWRAKRGRKW